MFAVAILLRWSRFGLAVGGLDELVNEREHIVLALFSLEVGEVVGTSCPTTLIDHGAGVVDNTPLVDVECGEHGVEFIVALPCLLHMRVD